jgi:GlpG protein
MRQIGTIPDEADAHRLADHLLTLGITTRLDRGPEGWALWIHREDQVPRARAELDAFRQAPADPRYAQAASAAKALRKQAERTEKEHERATRDVRQIWGRRNLRRCPVTIVLMAACIGVALWTNFGARDARVDPLLFARYEVYPVSVLPAGEPEEGTIRGPFWFRSNPLRDLARGEVWRLFTPALVHFGPLHLIFNLMWLYDLGALIEIRQNSRRLLGLVLLTAILANLGQYYWDHYPLFGGMSGVVFGLFGYIWMKGLYEPELMLGLHPNTVMFMVAYLAFTMMGGIPFIAHAAHLVGLIAGVVAGLAPHLLPRFDARADE